MKDAENKPAPEQDDELGSLFARAAPRARPRPAAEAAAFRALHAEWAALTLRRRRRRMVAAAGIAASLLLALAAGYTFVTPRDGPPAVVADVARVEGPEVAWRDESFQRVLPAGGMPLAAGQSLSTGASSRVALAWRSGGSLRLDEHTRIELVSARSVQLVSGTVYFDSFTEGQTPDETPRLRIHTPAGEVLHAGTQFMVTVDADDVVLSVREGRVKIVGDGFELLVDPGEQLDVDATGRRAERRIERFGESWAWAAEIAPLPDLDGRSAFEILGWAGRETGRRIVYDSLSTESLARAAIVRGLDRRSAAATLELIPQLTDLRCEIREDAVVVSSQDRGGQ